MGLIYVSNREKILKAQYAVYKPESFDMIPAYCLEFNTDPIYSHDPSTQAPMTSAVATIAEMAEMYELKIVFTLRNPTDVLDMIATIEGFLDEVSYQPEVSGDTKEKNFRIRIMNLLGAFDQEKQRLYKSQKITRSRSDKLGDLMKLFGRIGS